VLVSSGEDEHRNPVLCVLAEVQLSDLVSECVIDILCWLGELHSCIRLRALVNQVQ
jgi:hypothetical protein